MDEFKLRRRRELGDKAKALLNNETLSKWWLIAEKSLVAQIKSTKPTDTEILTELTSLLNALEWMQRDFKRYVADGDDARSRLGEKSLLQKLKP